MTRATRAPGGGAGWRGRGGGGSGGGRPPAGGGPSGERPARRRSFLWRWRRAFFLLALLGLTCMAAGAVVVSRTELPELDPLVQSTFICDASVAEGCNQQNAMARIKGDQDRVNVSYEDLPDDLINAVIAMEDRDFFEHEGIDPVGIARALYQGVRNNGVQQGGSTITQQYVKNAFLSPEQTLTRKLNEAVLSIKLEQAMSKQEILEGYLNTIYFGRGVYGVQAASRAYFGMDVSELGIAESAYLAGLIRAPEAADAAEDPEEAERRRSTALVAMEEEGYITSGEREMANAVAFTEPWFKPPSEGGNFETMLGGDKGGEYITRYVNALLQRDPYNYTREEISGGGLRVYTSIDLDLQAMAWDAVQGVLNQPDDPAAAMVAVDEQGLMRAMVGGPGYEPGVSESNYAVRGSGGQGRAVGSTFKPIALAEAVSRGYSMRSVYEAPNSMTIEQEACDDWEVGNYAESEEVGHLDLVEATTESSNTAYGQLMRDLGPENVIEMAERLGIEGDFGAPCAPIVLGSDNATPLEMATVFSTFANEGLRMDTSIITRVERVDQDGNVSVEHQWEPPEGTRVLTADQANLITHALQTVVSEGTGTAADIGQPAAGKTGTTSDYKDAWFVGYVPQLTAAVWMGYPRADWDDPETPEPELVLPPMTSEGRPVHGRESVTGGSLPAEIWRNFMAAATDARGWNDPFPAVDEELLSQGRLLTGESSAPPGGGGDGAGGGQGDDDGGDRDDPPRSTTTSPTSSTTASTSTTAPSTSTTTTSTSTTSSSTTSTTEPPGPDPTIWPPPGADEEGRRTANRRRRAGGGSSSGRGRTTARRRRPRPPDRPSPRPRA